MNLNEKNPVPSIDNKYIQALIKVKSAGNCRDLEAIKLVEELIQNGVETTKEHPYEQLLEEAKYALNNIPNTKNVGINGESSYELVSSIYKRMVG